MAYVIQESLLPPGHALAIRATMPMTSLSGFFAAAFRELSEAVTRAGGSFAGPPFARYHSVAPDRVDVEAVMPVDAPVAGSGRAQPIELAGGPAVQLLHIGPYDAMVPAYQAIEKWVVAHHRRVAGPPREVYLTSPSAVPDPAGWRTLIVQPIA